MTRTVPQLMERMAAKRATDKDLAKRAGVHPTTVQKARRGYPVRSSLADCIEEALSRFSFGYPRKYQKHGRPLYAATP